MMLLEKNNFEAILLNLEAAISLTLNHVAFLMIAYLGLETNIADYF